MAKCKQTAIWAQLSKLPPEFYDAEILRKIGNKLGIILKVDAHTNDALRGQYARICVQVCTDNALKTRVYIGHHTQLVIYEGLNMICFVCGKVGHKNVACPDCHTNSSLPPLAEMSVDVLSS